MKTLEARFSARLTFDPHVSDTSPVVRGTWVTVDHVVSLIVDGWTWADILRTHPEMTNDDIRECLEYTVYMDSREETEPEAVETIDLSGVAGAVDFAVDCGLSDGSLKAEAGKGVALLHALAEIVEGYTVEDLRAMRNFPLFNDIVDAIEQAARTPDSAIKGDVS